LEGKKRSPGLIQGGEDGPTKPKRKGGKQGKVNTLKLSNDPNIKKKTGEHLVEIKRESGVTT